MKNSVEVVTFGCRLNSLESEIIRKRAAKAGLEGAIVVHTCAVTKEAERQALQRIRRASAERRGAKIIAAGCAAQNSAEKIAAIPGVCAVLGNAEKLTQKYYDLIAASKDEDAPLVFVGAGAEKTPAAAGALQFEGKTKAFVQVQQGCDNTCSYCIVPKLRGRNRSFPASAVIAQCRAAIRRGYREIVLTGVDISAYGSDTKRASLSGIAKEILDAFPELGRLRLSSLDPAKNYDQLLGLMKKEPRLMPHLHLSMQSGDDSVLAAMRRRHRASDIAALVKKIRESGRHIAIGADIIAGFPGETDEEFANTMRLVKECGITHLHVFPYSERPGTKAAALPDQVPVKMRRERARMMRELGAKLKLAFVMAQKGKTVQVLVEKDNRGYTENYIQVEIDGEKTVPNTIVCAEITKVREDGTAVAKIVRAAG